MTSVFVYGTLQRGEERGTMWPRPPVSVTPAMTRGRLHEMGEYPALVPGDDLIRGEIWHFDAENIAHTLAVLDEIEGYNQGWLDLYRRVVITCHTDDGVEHRAWVYHFARPNHLAGKPVVPPGPQGFCHWRSRT